MEEGECGAAFVLMIVISVMIVLSDLPAIVPSSTREVQ